MVGAGAGHTFARQATAHACTGTRSLAGATVHLHCHAFARALLLHAFHWGRCAREMPATPCTPILAHCCLPDARSLSLSKKPEGF